jgi:hypothetical protein
MMSRIQNDARNDCSNTTSMMEAAEIRKNINIAS